MYGAVGESNGPEGCEYMPPADAGIGPRLIPAFGKTGVPSYPEDTSGKEVAECQHFILSSMCPGLAYLVI